MSNSTDKRIIEEGWRNAVVKLTGVLTDADVSLVSIIAPSDFSNNDTIAGTLSGFRVDAIIYSLSGNLEGRLYWNGGTPELITPFARSGKIDVTGDGGFLPDTTNSGYDGSLNFSTAGFQVGTTQVYSVTLRLIKLYK